MPATSGDVVHLDDYQHGKEPDVWSQALWLGAALGVLKAVADGEQVDVTDARMWVDRVPVEVKAMWPGTFDEFPYDGESPEAHAQRRRHDSL